MKKIKFNLFIIILFFVFIPYFANPAIASSGAGNQEVSDMDKEQILNKFAKITPPIVENVGQIKNKSVKYYISSPGKSVFFTDKSVVMDLFKIEESKNSTPAKKGVVIKLSFEGATTSAIKGKEQKVTRVNYLKGKNQKNWKRKIKTFQQVLYTGIYNDIDLRYISTAKKLKYQFELAAGADAKNIRMKLDGIEKIFKDENGNLVIKSLMGNMVDKKPYTYQNINGKEVLVASAFSVINDTEFGFVLGEYDKSLPLIIDPGIAWSTFLGGELSERGMGVAIDSFGHIIVTGATSSTTFPTVNGLYSDMANKDVFISKLTSDGSSFLYSTYLGGSQDEEGHDIAFDRAGHTFVSGFTTSPDFPSTFTIGAGGGQDGFVVKLTPDGSTLDYSTIMGEAQDEQAHTMQVDGKGYAYITGFTYSANFPSGANHFTYGPLGQRDIFILKLNKNGDQVKFSASIGGSGDDDSHGLEINYEKHSFIVGTTSSADFPTTVGPAHAGGSDLFVLKLPKNGNSLGYSRLMGGAGNDTGYGIVVNEGGAINVLGYTSDTSFLSGPIRLGPGGGTDIFVASLDNTASAITSSVVIGGSGDDICHDIVRDGLDDLYIVGHTMSADFPISSDAVDNSYNNTLNSDMFLLKLSSNLSAILFSTYIGGDGNEEAHDLLLDSSGNAFLTGWTDSDVNFPITTGVADSTFAGAEEAFVLKIRITEPVQLFYSTYLGGSGEEEANAIAVDRYGDVYVSGVTTSSDFPTTIGAYDVQLGNSGSGTDVFVTKMEADSSKIVYSTFFGGSQDEFISHYSRAMAVDESENVYIAGRTTSPDFPTTPGANDSILGTAGSGQDAFITVIGADGNMLLYSTFLGGDQFDQVNAMALDKHGDILLTGVANSTESSLVNTIGPVPSGGKDAFVAKITPDDTTPGNDLVFFRYLGGSNDDFGHAIAVDYNRSAYIVGYSLSVTGEPIQFPVTAGAYKTVTVGSSSEVFVVKVDLNGNLVYSTFLGGAANVDEGYAIGLDPAGNVYVAGLTASSNFPTTVGAFQETFNGGAHDAFVSKLNLGGNGTSDLVYSTYIGGSKHDHIHDVFVTSIGEVYIAGTTASSDFPVSVFGFQSSIGGKDDAFVAELASAGDRLIFSTFIGGSKNEEGCSIVVDNAGSIYLSGKTASLKDFPITSGAVQEIYGGGSMDAFIAKLGIATTITPSSGGSYNSLSYLDLQGGTTLTTFTYKVLYQDPENVPLAAEGYVKVSIDGSVYNMVQETGCGIHCDGDFANGEEFYYSTQLGVGVHNYYFEASNGLLSSIRLPQSGVFDGPFGPEISPLPDVTVKFMGIVSPGDVTASRNNEGVAPIDYVYGIDASYDIASTSNNGGEDVIITINYTDSQVFDLVKFEDSLRLLHNDNGAWVDITSSLDKVNNIITGVTQSFSPFMLASSDLTFTPVSLLYFKPIGVDQEKVTLEWATGSEIDNEGFSIYRSNSRTGGYQKISNDVIYAQGSIINGVTYNFVDNNIDPGVKYFYRLDDIDSSGRQTQAAYADTSEFYAEMTNEQPEAKTVQIESFEIDREFNTDGQNNRFVGSFKTISYVLEKDKPNNGVESFNVSKTGAGVVIKWSSKNNQIAGFNIFKSSTPDGDYVLVNDNLIESVDFFNDKNTKTNYSYQDKVNGERYFYKISAVFNDFQLTDESSTNNKTW